MLGYTYYTDIIISSNRRTDVLIQLYQDSEASRGQPCKHQGAGKALRNGSPSRCRPNDHHSKSPESCFCIVSRGTRIKVDLV